MFKVLENYTIAENIYKLKVVAPRVAKNAKPGNFIILSPEVGAERIPLTIVDYDREEGSVTIIYQVVGNTTKLLTTKKDYIKDFLGPLGNQVEFKDDITHVVGVAGGLGAAPLYPQLKMLAEKGKKVDLIIGARTKDLLILLDNFKKFCNNIYICTDDGSFGEKGFVTSVLDRVLKEDKTIDQVIAIGPPVMMKACVEVTKPYNIPINVSLNPIMVDGTGMCGSCRVLINNELKFACIDGPDFDGYSVDFDTLIKRLRLKKTQDDKDHKCKIGLQNENK